MGRPFFRLAIFKIRYFKRKLVKLFMNFGKGVSLTCNTSKCKGAWLNSCYPSLKGESLVLEHVIVFLLVMLAIVHAIYFLSSKVIY